MTKLFCCLMLILAGSIVASAQDKIEKLNDTERAKLNLSNGSLHYEAMGVGSPVVLLHGGGSDLHMWDKQANTFAKHFRIIRYDLRGHGESSPATGTFSDVDDLEKLLDHLGHRKVSLVGLSKGSGVALNFTLAHPERVDRLVLVSSSGPPPGVPVAEGTVVLTNAATLYRLKEIGIPVLVMIGDGDSSRVVGAAEAAVAGIKGARKVVIPNAKHLVNVENPGVFNEIVIKFLLKQ
jgi:pimeloyl-ACP methyl ester carboxylesterase